MKASFTISAGVPSEAFLAKVFFTTLYSTEAPLSRLLSSDISSTVRPLKSVNIRPVALENLS